MGCNPRCIVSVCKVLGYVHCTTVDSVALHRLNLKIHMNKSHVYHIMHCLTVTSANLGKPHLKMHMKKNHQLPSRDSAGPLTYVSHVKPPLCAFFYSNMISILCIV